MCLPGSCVGSLNVINIYQYLLTITMPSRYGILFTDLEILRLNEVKKFDDGDRAYK